MITFHGFLKAYVEGADDPDSDADDRETRLPNVAEGDAVTAAEHRRRRATRPSRRPATPRPR